MIHTIAPQPLCHIFVVTFSHALGSVPSPTCHQPTEKVIRKQELEKALRSYQAVEGLRDKIDKELLEESLKGIALIEHMLRVFS